MAALDKLTQSFGERLAAYRVSRGLKQSELADMAGIDRTTLVRLEKGRGNIDSLARILTALDVADRLVEVVPDTRLNPLDPMAGRGERRQRVRTAAKDSDDGETWHWEE